MPAACCLLLAATLHAADLPTPTAWYRADGAVVVNDAVTALADASPRAVRLSVGAKPPKLVPAALNGQPVLRFAGEETPLVDPSCHWSAAGFTVFAVAAYATIPARPVITDHPHQPIQTPGQALVADGGVSGLALGLNWNGRPGACAAIGHGDGPSVTDPPYANSQASDLLLRSREPYLLVYGSPEGKRSANAWDCRVPLSIAANGTPSSVSLKPQVSVQAMNGGRGLQLGAAGGKERFKGDLAEVLVYDRELNAAERTAVSEYLRAKYALTAEVKRLPPDVSVGPVLADGRLWFRDQVRVELQSSAVGAQLRYTLDGSEPTAQASLYAAPFVVQATTTVKARAFAEHADPGAVATGEFIKIAPVPPSARQLAAGWKYSWGDEFAGPEVDRAIWGNELGYVRNNEAQFYTDRPENAFIDHGQLVIRGLHDNWNGKPYTAASLSTENKVKLTYGRYELRAKIDTRSGSWPAWWLWSRPDSGGWPKEGEVDMMEYYRGTPLLNVMDGAQRWSTVKRKLSLLGGQRWSDAFHVWTMDWDADKLDLYLDGVLCNHYVVARADGTGLKGENPFRHPETKKMVLNQALGGANGGQLSPQDCPFDLRVDWLRIHTVVNEPAFTVTVNGGIGGGPYVVGTPVSVTAKLAPAGYEFDGWVVDGGRVDEAANPTARLTMPANDVTVTATYRPSGGH